MHFLTRRIAGPLVLGVALFTLPISNALAGRCGDDIRRIDEALKNQYGGSGAWWE
jgi:hypothetical protein